MGRCTHFEPGLITFTGSIGSARVHAHACVQVFEITTGAVRVTDRHGDTRDAISRIQEEHTRSGDNTATVATGPQRTGRLVTAAAVLIPVALGALATSGITYLKMLGVGLALAVLVDAFIVRALLVPALMRLAGEANWWAHALLHRVHARLGLRH